MAKQKEEKKKKLRVVQVDYVDLVLERGDKKQNERGEVPQKGP